MSYRVLWHPTLPCDLVTINNLVANYAGQVVALRNLDEIEHTLRWLADLLAAACCATNIVPGLCVIFAGRR